MNKTEEIDKKPNFRPDFGWPKFDRPNFFLWVLPILDVRHCCKLSLYAISRKTDEQNLRKWQKKTLVSGSILTQIRAAIFFFFQKSGSVSF